MRVGAVVLLSLLGMSSSSAAVAWLMPREGAPVESKAFVQQSVEPDEPSASVTEPAGSTLSIDGPLRLAARLGHATLPAERPGETYVLVEVEASADVPAKARAPANVAMVIDRSGSMKGQRLRNAVAAARGMLSRLRPTDTVSLVAYDSEAQLLMPATTVDRIDRFAFERTLGQLRGSGNTCISCGVDLALQQLRRRTGSINRVLLLSDGVANRGLTRPDDFRALGDLARRERVAVASIGVDVDYDERTLFALSQASNANHYFVEEPSGLPEVFENEARTLIGSVADRADVEVVLADGVEIVEVIARGHRREDDRVTLSLGTFNAGEDKSVLLRVRVPEGQGARPVADVRLAYRDLSERRDHAVEGQLGLTMDPSVTTVAALDPLVEERLGRKDTLDALLTANEAFARGDLTLAQRQLDTARDRVLRRRRRSGAGRGSKVDRKFDQQLRALDSAKISFDDVILSEPVPKKAAKSRRGKKAIRRNAVTANPFG